jgi:hypothetical protein
MNSQVESQIESKVASGLENFSFYIPRVRAYWSQEQISEAMYMSFYGYVERVDLGDQLPDNQSYRSVFVHLSPINPTVAEYFNNQIKENGFFKFQVRPNEFWMILPNNNPISKTHLNIHQLADITKKQKEQITNLENEVSKLKNMVELLICPPPLPVLKRQTNMIDIEQEIDFDDVLNKFKNLTIEDDYSDLPELIYNKNLTPESSIRIKNTINLCGND